MFRFAPDRQRGFTLLEMAMVLLIVGLAAAMLLNTSGGILDARKRETVRTQLTALDGALANFVAVNRRLPCPADGRINSNAASAGVETLSPGPPPGTVPARGTCNPATQPHGVVPWVTLGLDESAASDPWAGRISYRVDPALAGGLPRPLLMDMSACDPAATGAPTATGACQTPAVSCTGSAACTSPALFLTGKGLEVWHGQNGVTGWFERGNNRAAGSGAAYVLISHGPSKTGAYNATGTLQSGTLSRLEERNANGRPMVLPTDMASAFVDAPLNDRTSLVPTPIPAPVPPPVDYYEFRFDDYLSHPTLMSVLAKANLGPRAH